MLTDLLYIESRYPGDMGLLPNGKPTLANAKEFYNEAENIFNQVCSVFKITIEKLKNNVSTK